MNLTRLEARLFAPSAPTQARGRGLDLRRPAREAGTPVRERIVLFVESLAPVHPPGAPLQVELDGLANPPTQRPPERRPSDHG